MRLTPKLMKKLILAICLVMLSAPASFATPFEDALRNALYPGGLAEQQNPITGKTERPQFVPGSAATVPDTSRTVVVYAERFDDDMPFEKMHRVFVAVVESSGDSMRVLDRREVTGELKLFLETAGHVYHFRALATPLRVRDVVVVAVELWTTLSGTAFLGKAEHLFYTLRADGTLVPALTLEDTYVTGRSGAAKAIDVATILVGTAATAGELAVARREVRWADVDSGNPTCGPLAVTRYRFNGTRYEKTEGRDSLPETGFTVLPRLPIQEKPACAN